MTLDQRNRLNKAIGTPFNYKGKNIVIDKFKEVGANVVVFVDERPFNNLLESEVEDFLENLRPPLEKELTPTQVGVPENKLKVFEPTKENEVVKKTLLETLERVKDNKDYIPQAQAVCAVVSQIVNVQKTEIQMLSIINKFK
jgi:hypothetical protein